MLFNILTVATLLTAASATPVPSLGPEVYTWEVTKWEAGCSRYSCTYGFDITGKVFGADPEVPAFTARCVHGADREDGSPLTPCGVTDNGIGNRGILSRLLPMKETGQGAHLEVEYRVTRLDIPVENNAYYSYTANTKAPFNAFSGPQLNFTMTPKLVEPIELHTGA